ncbi:hypothetical protein ACFLQ2_02775 [archaeon]
MAKKKGYRILPPDVHGALWRKAYGDKQITFLALAIFLFWGVSILAEYFTGYVEHIAILALFLFIVNSLLGNVIAKKWGFMRMGLAMLYYFDAWVAAMMLPFPGQPPGGLALTSLPGMGQLFLIAASARWIVDMIGLNVEAIHEYRPAMNKFIRVMDVTMLIAVAWAYLA